MKKTRTSDGLSEMKLPQAGAEPSSIPVDASEAQEPSKTNATQEMNLIEELEEKKTDDAPGPAKAILKFAPPVQKGEDRSAMIDGQGSTVSNEMRNKANAEENQPFTEAPSERLCAAPPPPTSLLPQISSGRRQRNRRSRHTDNVSKSEQFAASANASSSTLPPVELSLEIAANDSPANDPGDILAASASSITTTTRATSNKAQQFAGNGSYSTSLSLAPLVDTNGIALPPTVATSSPGSKGNNNAVTSGSTPSPGRNAVGAFQTRGRALGDVPQWGVTSQEVRESQKSPPPDPELATLEAELVIEETEQKETTEPMEIEPSVLAQAEKIDPRKQKYYIGGFVLLVAAIGVLLGVFLSTSNPEATSQVVGGIPTDRDAPLAFVPETICFDRMPGEGRSKLCSNKDTMPQGGGVGNFVAQAHWSVFSNADMVIHNAGAFRSDIAQGNFTGGDCEVLVPFNNELKVVDMRGTEIKLVLEQALDFIYSDPNDLQSGAYPYAAGLKFSVDLSADFGARVGNMQVQDRATNVWSSIEEYVMYTVVTNSYLAEGGDNYVLFSKIPSLTGTDVFMQESLREYAWQQMILEDPPLDVYSTVSFVPRPNVVPDDPDAILATVPETICYDRLPGEGRSKYCDQNATKERGSGVQNLVAQASWIPEADIVILNAGSVWVDIVEGNFTVADAEEVVPFNNELLLLNMTGSEIKLVLEEALESIYSDPEDTRTGSYPYAAGMRFSVNMSEILGNRLSDLQVKDRKMGTWSTMELNGTYTVSANDYIVWSSENWSTFQTISNISSTGLYATDVMMQYAWDEKVLLAPSLDDYSTISFTPR